MLSSSTWTYYLLEDCPLAYVYSCIVVISLFNMPPIVCDVNNNMAMYKLSDEVSKIINAKVDSY